MGFSTTIKEYFLPESLEVVDISRNAYIQRLRSWLAPVFVVLLVPTVMMLGDREFAFIFMLVGYLLFDYVVFVAAFLFALPVVFRWREKAWLLESLIISPFPRKAFPRLILAGSMRCWLYSLVALGLITLPISFAVPGYGVNTSFEEVASIVVNYFVMAPIVIWFHFASVDLAHSLLLQSVLTRESASRIVVRGILFGIGVAVGLSAIGYFWTFLWALVVLSLVDHFAQGFSSVPLHEIAELLVYTAIFAPSLLLIIFLKSFIAYLFRASFLRALNRQFD